jgi:hydrogenase maturation protease
VGRKLYPEKIPKEIFLVGVEGKCFDQLTDSLTAVVAEAVASAAQAVLALLDR